MGISWKTNCLLFSCLVLVLPPASDALAGREKRDSTVDWSSPSGIDPLRKGINDFLEEDLSVHRLRAEESYKRGKYKDAAAAYLFILRHRYDDPVTLYNLACCYGRLGEAELAADNLVRAVTAGFTRFDLIAADKDFEKVREHRYFSERMAAIERLRQELGDMVYVKASSLIECRIKLPPDFDPGKSYPLVIGLHGNGGSADGFIKIARFLHGTEVIFAAPRGAYRKADDVTARSGQYSWEIQVRNRELWKRGDPLTVEHIRDVARELSSRFRIDGVYLIGFSQGAAYAYITGIRHHQDFDGIVAIGGILPDTTAEYTVLTDRDLESGTGLPVLIAHSPQDQALGFRKAVEARKRLRKLGYEVTFIEYEGGHQLTSDLLGQVGRWLRKERAASEEEEGEPRSGS